MALWISWPKMVGAYFFHLWVKEDEMLALIFYRCSEVNFSKMILISSVFKQLMHLSKG